MVNDKFDISCSWEAEKMHYTRFSALVILSLLCTSVKGSQQAKILSKFSGKQTIFLLQNLKGRRVDLFLSKYCKTNKRTNQKKKGGIKLSGNSNMVVPRIEITQKTKLKIAGLLPLISYGVGSPFLQLQIEFCFIQMNSNS